MIYKEHYIELFVNGHQIDLEDQKSLNMRFNNVLYDPTKISSTPAEYSFEFEVPATPNNNKIFDYANNFSKLNKFHQRYNAEVYADGTIIFNGTITLNSFKGNKYQVNLVSVKIYSLDDIFGDMTMNDIKWEMPFEGGGSAQYSMDWYNATTSPDAVFPLIGYGVFQKGPVNPDDSVPEYTSKYIIDQYNRWYVESFYPSHNLLKCVKKAFETKGYNVMGDVFNDPYLKEIYASVNLADGQVPMYNLGNPKFGNVEISASITTNGTGYEQELHFPYYRVYAVGATSEGITSQTEYNYSSIQIYDILASGNTPTVASASYMYQPNEHLIVIPADGWYKIEMTANSTLNTTGTITAKQFVVDMIEREMSEVDLDLPVGFGEITPIEIQLVRNYSDNIELIKGKHNKKYNNGNPLDEYYYISGRRYENVVEWDTCFPHEDLYNSILPTEKNDLTLRNTHTGLGGRRTSEASNVTQDEDGNWTSGNDDTSASGNFSGYRGNRAGTRGDRETFGGSSRNYGTGKMGYVYNDRELMAYDQAVSNSFICGLSSMSNGVPSVMKNGYSWSPMTSIKNEVFAPVIGYSFMTRDNDTISYSSTTHNHNTYINTPISYCNTTNTSMNGYVSCMVWLNKDDILNLVAIQRGYENVAGNNVNYSTTTNVNLKITAFSDRTYDMLKAAHTNRYDAPIEFSDKLNLANFLNKEKKVSEWIQNVIDAFNIELVQSGNNVFLNTAKKNNSNVMVAVDIDNRVDVSNSESSIIEYPRSMAVKYKIDSDEWGAERSAVEAAGGDESILNTDEWKKYINSGYTIIELNDDSYVTTTSDKSLQFSYTWYQGYNWFPVNENFELASGAPPTPIRTPAISKYSYMIDGYDYAESMKHDGYGLTQRLWFRPTSTECYVYTRTYPAERVQIYTPRNEYNGLNLSYKDTERSLLTDYFNIGAYLSANYIEIEVYLNPTEYDRIKGGSLVHVDSDLYIPVEIEGYDPSGNNPTTLKLMKKVN